MTTIALLSNTWLSPVVSVKEKDGTTKFWQISIGKKGLLAADDVEFEENGIRISYLLQNIPQSLNSLKFPAPAPASLVCDSVVSNLLKILEFSPLGVLLPCLQNFLAIFFV